MLLLIYQIKQNKMEKITKKMNIKKIKSHENMEKMPFSKKFVAFFLANSWHENSGIENSISPTLGVLVPFGYALWVFMPFRIWHENLRKFAKGGFYGN